MEAGTTDWKSESARVRKNGGIGDYTPPQPFVAQRTLDRSLWYEGQLLVFYAEGPAVDNSCCIWEGNIPEGMGPPPHLHLYEHECFYILEGHLNAWVEGVKYDVPKNSLIFLPAGRAHWFVSAAPVTRMLSLTVTAKPEFPASHLNRKFFELVGRPAEALTLPNMPKADHHPDFEALKKFTDDTGSHFFDIEKMGWQRGFGERGQVGEHRDE
jgi:mannose-6-phosphate isomerase-like protein (cupin superfamily)